MAYSKAWDELRARQRVAWLLPLTIVPAGFIAGQFHSRAIFFPMAAFLCAVIFTATRHLYAFKCPRCRQPYFARKGHANAFSGKCLHCELPKWTTSEMVQTEWWLFEPSLPELEWSRIRVFSDGAADTLNEDDEKEWFASVDKARVRLSRRGFVQLSSIETSEVAQTGFSIHDLVPPAWPS